MKPSNGRAFASTGDADIVVIGAGLAGLTAAALVARAGKSVVVVEQARNSGGRATTSVEKQALFNLGAHALYAQGHAARLFREMGVPFTGHFPSPGRGLLTHGRQTYRIPAGLGSLAVSRLLTVRDKLRLARLLATINRLNTRELDCTTAQEWILQTAGRGNLAAMLGALFNVATFVADHQRLSAGVALDQLRSALVGNVLYLDGGWQTLVDGLQGVAVERGAEIRANQRAVTIEPAPHGATVHLARGGTLTAGAVILAVAPSEAVELLRLTPDAPLARWTARQQPVQVACLDVALSKLPVPRQRFALGLDKAMYFSVHSAAAKLAPAGMVVLHLMKYLSAGGDDAAVTEEQLDDYLSLLQPGWQQHVVVRRFLPRMTVCPALPSAEDAGLSGRPDAGALADANVYLAGDWVGPAGTLADAAAASAEQAARLAVSSLGPGRMVTAPRNFSESVLDVRR